GHNLGGTAVQIVPFFGGGLFLFHKLGYGVIQMKKRTGNELRGLFLEYFKNMDHMVEPSAPLVPIDDDSLLWLISEVAPLKVYVRLLTCMDLHAIISIRESSKKEELEYAWDQRSNKESNRLDPDLI